MPDHAVQHLGCTHEGHNFRIYLLLDRSNPKSTQHAPVEVLRTLLPWMQLLVIPGHADFLRY